MNQDVQVVDDDDDRLRRIDRIREDTRMVSNEVEMPNNNLHQININPVSSGYVVTVGCQTIAIETTKTLVDTLQAYLDNPSDFEKGWFNNNNRSKV